MAVLDSDAPIWFAEPAGPDDTWGRRGEHPLDWLARSTVPRAAAAREFLNRNLAALPDHAQPVLFSALRSRWQSAFFELVVARTLQALGASLTVEPESRDGSRIDFVAAFSDSHVNVEAVSPNFHPEAGEAIKARHPLLDIVESLVPIGWGAMVLHLPAIGPNHPKRPFRETIVRMMASLPLDGIGPLDLTEDMPEGELHLRLWPGRFGNQPILMEPALTAWNDSEQRIRRAVARKKRQARAADGPSLVAIHAAGMSSRFEDFDLALFGRTFERINQRLEIVESGLRPDGVFAAQRLEPPVVAGVLAFIRVGYRPFPDPVLYLHPRSEGRLPDAIRTLEVRHLDSDRTAIQTRPPCWRGLQDVINFVPDGV